MSDGLKEHTGLSLKARLASLGMATLVVTGVTPACAPLSEAGRTLGKSIATELGLSKEESLVGKPISPEERSFRLESIAGYVPIREEPTQAAKILGWAKTGTEKEFTGNEFWGGTYSSVDNRGTSLVGERTHGKWVRGVFTLYADKAGSRLKNEPNQPTEQAGFVDENSISFTSPKSTPTKAK